MKPHFVRTLIAAAGLCLAAAAHATTFSYNDFSSTAGLTLNGSAGTSSNELMLTPASYYVGGSAFTTNAITLGANVSFSTAFSFRITNSGGVGDSDGPGADGLTFVVQTVANNVGGVGGGLGYQGISNSVGVEFDTYNNGGPCDPNGNHVGIDLGGSVCSAATAVVGTSLNPGTRMNNGGIWYAWVDYNGATSDMQVRLSQTNARPSGAILDYTVDLVSALGTNNAYIGFTAATGAGIGQHDILSWQFNDTYSPINGAPEPGMLALLGAAFAGMAALRRKAA